MSDSGALLSARYSVAPNRLGYCGPDANAELVGYLREGKTDAGLMGILRRFEAAYPYLSLIASSNGIEDPFDPRVVEAYWIGNRLLPQAGGQGFDVWLEDRYRSRIPAGAYQWLRRSLAAGGLPSHNYHVVEVYRRAGALRGDRADVTLPTMDACRISWGRIMSREGEHLIVERAPLRYHAGRLELGRPEPTAVLAPIAPDPVLDQAAVGDLVSIHWGSACSTIGPSAARRLRAQTLAGLRLANLSL